MTQASSTDKETPNATRRWSLFQWALMLSALLHASLLLLRFAAPERFEALFNAEALEVVLVNTRSEDTPDKAQALAQASLAGGGDSADKDLRATSPFPFTGVLRDGDAAQDSHRSIQTLQTQQAILLAQVKSQLALPPTPELGKPQTAEQAKAEVEQRKRLMNIVAEIERRIQAENAKPKKRYISPATKEFALAQQYDVVRRRIEDYGTENFPVGSNGKKLYGEVMMAISIGKDGKVQSANILRHSLSDELDAAAQKMVLNASGRFGFGAFTNARQHQVDVLVMITTLKFKNDGAVRSEFLQEVRP